MMPRRSKRNLSPAPTQICCGFCDMSNFADKDALECHLANDHLGWTPYECYYCRTVRTPTKATLMHHVKASHPQMQWKLVKTPHAGKKMDLKRMLSTSLRKSTVRCPAARPSLVLVPPPPPLPPHSCEMQPTTSTSNLRMLPPGFSTAKSPPKRSPSVTKTALLKHQLLTKFKSAQAAKKRRVSGDDTLDNLGTGMPMQKRKLEETEIGSGGSLSDSDNRHFIPTNNLDQTSAQDVTPTRIKQELEEPDEQNVVSDFSPALDKPNITGLHDSPQTLVAAPVVGAAASAPKPFTNSPYRIPNLDPELPTGPPNAPRKTSGSSPSVGESTITEDPLVTVTGAPTRKDRFFGGCADKPAVRVSKTMIDCRFCGNIGTSSVFRHVLEKHFKIPAVMCPYCSYCHIRTAAVVTHCRNAHLDKKVGYIDKRVGHRAEIAAKIDDCFLQSEQRLREQEEFLRSLNRLRNCNEARGEAPLTHMNLTSSTSPPPMAPVSTVSDSTDQLNRRVAHSIEAAQSPLASFERLSLPFPIKTDVMHASVNSVEEEF